MLSLTTSTSVLAADDPYCWNQLLDGDFVMVCNEAARDMIDLELIKGEEAMKQLEIEVGKRPIIRIFWGVAGFLGGYLVSKAIN